MSSSDALERGCDQFPLSEKARSEFIVAPIVLDCVELNSGPLSVQSGIRLDVEPARGLVGEFDFLFSAREPLPGLRPPLLMTIAQAKEHDIEAGLWSCFAQMVGLRIFNERSGYPIEEIFGCVTEGYAWQFLRLVDHRCEIDRSRYYLSKVGAILAIFSSILERHAASKLAK